jgi:hypothetical protein
MLLGVRDLPDPTEPLSDEERDLFGIIDGRHTVGEVMQAAPLTDFEAQEALFRMLESGWIEAAGRRDGIAPPAPAAPHAAPHGTRRSWARELAVVGAVLVALVGLRLAARLFEPPPSRSAPEEDVFVAAQVRDLRFALDLYRRERGRYPERLEQLADNRFVESAALRVRGYNVLYRLRGGGGDYVLDLQPDR